MLRLVVGPSGEESSATVINSPTPTPRASRMHFAPQDSAEPAGLDDPAVPEITGDPDVDQLVSEIAQTRSDMSGTVPKSPR